MCKLILFLFCYFIASESTFAVDASDKGNIPIEKSDTGAIERLKNYIGSFFSDEDQKSDPKDSDTAATSDSSESKSSASTSTTTTTTTTTTTSQPTISTQGQASTNFDFKSTGVPIGVQGTILILDAEGNKLPSKDGLPEGVRVENEKRYFRTLKDSNGNAIEMEKFGTTFIKVRVSFSSGTKDYWIEKDKDDFIFSTPSTHPLCIQSTYTSTLYPQSDTRVYEDQYTYGFSAKRNSEYNVKLSYIDCSQTWLPGCVQSNKGGWEAVWMKSEDIAACNETSTEAGSTDIQCLDCGEGKYARQYRLLEQQALSKYRRTDPTLTQFVPENLHQIAIATAREERRFANGRYRRMNVSQFDNYIADLGCTRPPEAKVNTCRNIIARCHGKGCAESQYTPCYGLIKKCDRPTKFTGYCLQGVRETLIDAGMIPDVPTIGGSPKDPNVARNLEKYGFKNLIDKFPPPNYPNLPPGAVMLYKNPEKPSDDGHAEVYTGSSYCSDFCWNEPISSYRPDTRQPYAIYIKTKAH